MRCTHFYIIQYNFHCSDNVLLDQADTFGKMQPLTSMLNERYLNHAILSEQMSVEESMAPFWETLRKTIHLRKPICFGYKFWCLCDWLDYLVQSRLLSKSSVWQGFGSRCQCGSQFDKLAFRSFYEVKTRSHPLHLCPLYLLLPSPLLGHTSSSSHSHSSRFYFSDQRCYNWCCSSSAKTTFSSSQSSITCFTYSTDHDTIASSGRTPRHDASNVHNGKGNEVESQHQERQAVRLGNSFFSFLLAFLLSQLLFFFWWWLFFIFWIHTWISSMYIFAAWWFLL